VLVVVHAYQVEASDKPTCIIQLIVIIEIENVESRSYRCSPSANYAGMVEQAQGGFFIISLSFQASSFAGGL
jgi:hypothetical protein